MDKFIIRHLKLIALPLCCRSGRGCL